MTDSTPLKIPKIIGNSILGFSLIGFILAITTLYLWTYHIPAIDLVDQATEDYAKKHYLSKLKSASASLTTQPSDAIIQLEHLLDSLNEVNRFDLRRKMKEVIYFSLAQAYHNQNNTHQGIFWHKQLISFNPNNIDAQITLADHLLDHPEYEDEGFERLKMLFQQMPEVNNLAGVYFKRLNEYGYIKEGSEVLKEHVDARIPDYPKEWLVSWDTGYGFTKSNFAKIQTRYWIAKPNQLKLVFQIPKSSKRLLINLPKILGVEFSNPYILLSNSTKGPKLNTQEIPFKFRGLTKSELSFKVNGSSDPSFIWSLPKTNGIGVVFVELVSDITYPDLPEWASKKTESLDSPRKTKTK